MSCGWSTHYRLAGACDGMVRHGLGFSRSEGMQVPRKLKVAWQLPGGVFPYFQSEITSFRAMR